MAEDQVLVQTEEPKSSNLWNAIKEFYHNNFPTDTASFNARIPFLALTCSLTLVFIPMTQHFVFINIMISFFVVLISAASYQLYYGLKIRDKKQLMPWILLKFFEIIVALGIGGYFLIRPFVYTSFYGTHLNPWKCVIMAFLTIILGINVWIYSVVIIQWNKLRKEDNLLGLKTSSLISSIWRAFKEFYHKDSPTEDAVFNIKIPLLSWVAYAASMISWLNKESISFSSSALFDLQQQACSLVLTQAQLADFYFIRIFCFTYFLVISGVTFQLYYGLKIRDKKQFMPYIIFKFIEIILMMTFGSYGIYRHLNDALPYNRPDAWTLIIISFLVKIAVMNIVIYMVVIRQWQKLRKEENLARILEAFNPNSFEKAKPEAKLELTN